MKCEKSKRFDNVNRYLLSERGSKVNSSDFGKPYEKGSSFADFISSLPNILAVSDFHKAVNSIVKACKSKRPVILGMGAHVIKVGLSPIVIDLVNRGIITAIATNGASLIHDFELAFAGSTSEDVEKELLNGSFGMAEETAVMLNGAIIAGVEKGCGIGSSVGELIYNHHNMPNKSLSIFSECYRLGVPVTVHVAIGTDIIHMHPEADGRAIGEGSLIDFHRFTALVSELEGGVFINLGSAVIIPEVFLKALNLARNTGHSVNIFTTIIMDFIKQYRAMENVLKRPTSSGGVGISFTGHHELMFPLLSAAVIEEYGTNG